MAERQLSRQAVVDARRYFQNIINNGGGRRGTLDRQTPDWLNHHETITNFNDLLRQNPSSPEAVNWTNRQLRQFILSEEPTNIVLHASSELANDRFSQIGAVIERVTALEADFPQEAAEFRNGITTQLEREITTNWERISHQQLAELIQVYTHNPLASESARRLLAAYFRGPIETTKEPKGKKITDNDRLTYHTQLRDRVTRAHETLAHSMLDLFATDQETAENAVRIGFFDQPNIISAESSYAAVYYAVFNTALHKNEEDNKYLARVTNTDRIVGELARYYFSSEEFMRMKQNANSRTIHSSDNSAFQKEIRTWLRLGWNAFTAQGGVKNSVITTINDRSRLVVEALNYQPPFLKTTDVTKEAEVAHQLIAQWPLNVISADIELRRRFRAIAGPQLFTNKLLKDAREAFSHAGAVQPVDLLMATFNPPGTNDSCGILFPQSLALQTARLIEMAGQRNTGLANQIEMLTQLDAIRLIFPGSFSIENIEDSTGHTAPVFFWRRQLGENEQSPHPMTAIEHMGFPVQDTLQNLVEDNKQRRQRILDTRRIFLNTRGVRIPLEGTQLANLGYTNISFRKNRDEISETIITLETQTGGFSILLDTATLQFNLQGNTFANTVLLESLMNFTLLCLEPVVCREPEERTATTEESETTRKITTRSGHLRKLQPGQRYSIEANKNHWDYEGFDLAVANARRRLTIDPNATWTYVKPIETEENLPPYLVRIDPTYLNNW